MPGNQPILKIQTASLYASGDTSTFIGTGGPVPFDPFLSTFGGTITGANLASTPFADKVFSVDAGDQVTFVIAVENYGTGLAYNVTLRNSVPAGFIVPVDGGQLTVVTGADTPLNYTGNLFDPAGGLTITDSLYSFDQYSGANIALITFTLQATNTITAPLANITDSAQVVGYAASPTGANLAGSSSTSLTATTPIQTGAITLSSAADQTVAPLDVGQTASYDITVTLPEGTLQDLRINEALPSSGTAGFRLVSAQIVQFGANLSASAPVAVQSDGSVALGTVVNAYDNLVTPADQIVLRVTVTNPGTGGGTGTLTATVSAADPNQPGQRWSTSVTNTQALKAPNTPPAIFGVSANQNSTSSTPVLPFSSLLTLDPDVGQTESLTIHLSNTALGTLKAIAGSTTNAAGDMVLSGTMDQVQTMVRSLVFTPAANATGTETFGLSLNDGIATVSDTHTTVTLAATAHPSDLAQFPISPLTVLTSTPTGSSTLTQVQTYFGPLDNVQSQFLYDGAGPLAIVAQQTSMLISSKASATAVQLLGGANVVNMEQGSSFLVGGLGNDTIILHADQPQVTWNTIANFHSGDSITIYGYHNGLSTSQWVANAGAAGWTGATLHMDLNGDKTIDSSLTFAGKSLTDTTRFYTTLGNVGGQDYMLITA